MSFQAYLKTIKEKTGKGPADFKAMAAEKKFLQDGVLTVKAGEITAWLKNDFGLGQGHGMAIYALLKGIKNEDSL